jgi:hypothetical protein
MNMTAIALTRFQIAYMTRPYLKVKEEFLNKLFENIAEIGFRKMGKTGVKLEDELIALVIRAFGSGLQERQNLCGHALEALEILVRPDKVEKSKTPDETFIIRFEVPEIEKGVQKMVIPSKLPEPVKVIESVAVDNGLPENDNNCVLDTCAKCGKIAKFKKIKLVRQGKLIPKLAVECGNCKSILKPFNNRTEAMLGWNSRQRELREKKNRNK